MADRETRTKKGAAPLSLREELLGEISAEEFGLKKRQVSVMTRMNEDVVEILDALVELEIFKSRSEVVAAFVEKVISARQKLFDEMKVQAGDIRRQRDAAKKLAFQAMQDSRE
ncbi:MAG: hypothetical protein ACFFD9_10595 [Candidatus Thorarchaeota archaeon]